MVETLVRLGAARGSSKLGEASSTVGGRTVPFREEERRNLEQSGKRQVKVGILGGRICCSAVVIWRYGRNAVGIVVDS